MRLYHTFLVLNWEVDANYVLISYFCKQAVEAYKVVRRRGSNIFYTTG
jgi:hypothetical protein